MDYLRGKLDRQVKLKELAKVACFSEFHFHRIFGEVSGETLNNFTDRIRVERAARLLDLQRTLRCHEYDLPTSPEEERAASPVRLIDVPERQLAYIRVKNAFEGDGYLPP